MESRLPGFGWVWQATNLLASVVVLTVLFAMIYKYLPDMKIVWTDVIVGAAVTAVLFTVGKYLIGLYLGQVAVGNAYGAAGSFAVLLVWTYYSALISFFGAEFTQVWARRRGARVRPEDFAVRVEHRVVEKGNPSSS
jgi:membrane protein